MFHFTYHERRCLFFMAGVLLLGAILRFYHANRFVGTYPPVSLVRKPAMHKVNINLATQAQLEAIPGIGPQSARAIIAYRTKYSYFYTAQDLTKVKGVNEKKAKEFAKYISFIR